MTPTTDHTALLPYAIALLDHTRTLQHQILAQEATIDRLTNRIKELESAEDDLDELRNEIGAIWYDHLNQPENLNEDGFRPDSLTCLQQIGQHLARTPQAPDPDDATAAALLRDIYARSHRFLDDPANHESIEWTADAIRGQLKDYATLSERLASFSYASLKTLLQAIDDLTVDTDVMDDLKDTIIACHDRIFGTLPHPSLALAVVRITDELCETRRQVNRYREVIGTAQAALAKAD